MSLALLVCIGLQKRMNKNQACKVTLVVHLNASSLLTLICTEDEKNNKCLSTNTHGKYGLKMLLVTAQATPTKRKKDEAAASPGYRNVSGTTHSNRTNTARPRTGGATLGQVAKRTLGEHKKDA